VDLSEPLEQTALQGAHWEAGIRNDASRKLSKGNLKQEVGDPQMLKKQIFNL
jgi:hypothetical protein